MVYYVKSKDPKVPPRIQLNPSWRPPRDPITGALLPEGKLWDFTERIARSRREGKNRRDGATVASRVLRLADEQGRKLFDLAEVEAKEGKVPNRINQEEEAALKTSLEQERRRRRTAEGASKL